MKFFAITMFTTLATFTACATDATTSSSARAIIQQACAADTDCPTGFECESETEHSVTTTFCQQDEAPGDDAVNGNCPAGYELEVEEGQSFCKPHGGTDDGTHTGTDAGTDDGTTDGGAAACTTSNDCASNLECDDGACVAHGGHS